MRRSLFLAFCLALLALGCAVPEGLAPRSLEASFALEDYVPSEPAPMSAPTATVPLQTSEAAKEDEWRFVLAPYAWLLAIDGSGEVDGTSFQVDEDFDDIFDDLSFVVEGRFEAWKGRWGALADLTYARLESDVAVGPLDAETTTDTFLGLVGGLYRFVDQERAADGSGGVKVDGIFGVGITSIDTEIDFSGGPPDVDGDDAWVDPIFGLRTRWGFSEKWGGSLESVIGGFELFDGSDLFTMFTALVGRRMGEDKYLYFGWRSLDIDYDDGSSFESDVRISGPIVGFEFGF